MDLLTLRQKFGELSGRWDLVDSSTYADTGADFFISAGIRDLDGRLGHAPTATFARKALVLEAGFQSLVTSGFRVFKEVSIIDNEESERTHLEFIEYHEMRELYSAGLGGSDRSIPAYWTNAHFETVPDRSRLTAANLVIPASFWDVTMEASHGTQGVILYPPADKTYYAEVFGVKWSDELSDDSDTNFWTRVHPEVALWAAMRALEVSYRNSQGVNDWDKAIERAIFQIDKDFAEQDDVGMTGVEGGIDAKIRPFHS